MTTYKVVTAAAKTRTKRHGKSSATLHSHRVCRRALIWGDDVGLDAERLLL